MGIFFIVMQKLHYIVSKGLGHVYNLNASAISTQDAYDICAISVRFTHQSHMPQAHGQITETIGVSQNLHCTHKEVIDSLH